MRKLCAMLVLSIFTIVLTPFDLHPCTTPVKILDILADLKGDVTGRFEDYTWEANYDLIKKACSETSFLKCTRETSLKILSRYPDSLRCK